MALALIHHEGTEHGRHRFRIELGRNAYFAYAIGSGESKTPYGFTLLQDRSHTSNILGPLEDSDMGETEILVPSRLFDRNHSSIQLMSFRTLQKVGPTYSNILTIPPISDEELPTIQLPFERTSTMTALSPAHASLPRASLASVRIRHRKAVSTTQFLEGLVSLLPSLLPSAGNVIQALMSPRFSPPPRNASDSSLVDVLRQILSMLGKLQPSGSNPPAPEAPVVAPARTSSVYSEACFAPALLAALPALMPLLQSVLSPQTIQSLLQTADPNRLIGSVSQAVQGLAQLGLQADKQEMENLRALNPGVDDPAFMGLLQSMSVNLNHVHSTPKYRRVESVKLKFEELTPVTLGGRPIVVVSKNRDLVFPLSMESSRPISKGTLRIVVKEAKSLRVLAHKSREVERQGPGSLPVPIIPSGSLEALRSGEDYLICAHLVWKNKSGQDIGTNMTQLVTVLDECTFDSVRESGDPIPLNDVDRYRDFWHKIWQDSFSREVARREFECKYYVTLDPSSTSVAQMPTSVAETEKGIRRIAARLKSGLVLSLERLNALLPDLGDYPSLNAAQLRALGSPAFAKRFHSAARSSAQFSGAPGISAALWVFPEIRIQTLLLKRAGQVNSNGHVLSLTDDLVKFPMPYNVHFLGVSSQ